MLIKNIKKEYKKTKKIIVFNEPFYAGNRMCKRHLVFNCPVCHPRIAKDEPFYSSLIRSQSAIRDYALCNSFELFVTLTIDPKIVDPFNHTATTQKMGIWLKAQRRNNPELKYIIVPELHKSGALHFHALFGNYYGSLFKTRLKTKTGLVIYNLESYKMGFTTATKITDSIRVSSYITKYVTKQLILAGNKKRYWISKNLNKPIKTYNINEQELLNTPPTNLYEHKSNFIKIYNIIK